VPNSLSVCETRRERVFICFVFFLFQRNIGQRHVRKRYVTTELRSWSSTGISLTTLPHPLWHAHSRYARRVSLKTGFRNVRRHTYRHAVGRSRLFVAVAVVVNVVVYTETQDTARRPSTTFSKENGKANKNKRINTYNF